MSSKVSRNWVCPFCSRAQTLSDGQMCFRSGELELAEHKYRNLEFWVSARACANTECGDVTLTGTLVQGDYGYGTGQKKLTGVSVIEKWGLRPASSEKPQPDYIPEPLREDYREACRIKDLSAKASATLARRCMQGMIRDFCKISKATLHKEIEELSKLVDAGAAPPGVTEETVEAINHVRSIGNIGAHMEKNIDLVVPVDPGEAQALIDLIELLFEEWYVARDVRARKLARVKGIAGEKASLKSGPTSEAEIPSGTT